MRDRESNPFYIKDGAQAGLSGKQVRWSAEQVNTIVSVVDPDGPESSGASLLRIEGVLWAPEKGSVVRLGEPNRDAKVVHQCFEVVSGGLSSMVYVEDPATTQPGPTIKGFVPA